MSTAKPEATSSRRRRLITRCLFGVLTAVFVLPFIVECWRQNDIRLARNEIRAEAEHVAALFEDVDDFPAWYRARLKGRDGTTEFRSLCESETPDIDNSLGRINKEHEWEMAAFWRDGTRPENPPDQYLLDEFIATSLKYQNEMAALRRFDCLLGVPDCEGESVSMIAPIHWFNVLHTRILALCWRDRRAEAAETAVISMELAARMRQPGNLVEGLVARSVFGLASGDIESLGSRMRFDAGQLRRLQRCLMSVELDFRQFVEAEFAHAAMTYRRDGIDWDNNPLLDHSSSAWFGWYLNRESWQERCMRFRRPAQEAREMAEPLRTWRPMIDALRNGSELPEQLGYGFNLESVKALRGSSRRFIEQRLRAFAAVRLAQAEGVAWEEISLDAQAFPDVKLTRGKDEITLDFRRDAEVLKAFDCDTWDAYDENVSPVKIERKPQ